MKKQIVIAIALLAALTSNAQNWLGRNDILYHSFRMPQVTELNPAMFASDANYYVTLPRFGFDFSLPVDYKDLGLKYDAQKDATIIDLNNLIDKLDDGNNLIGMDIDMNLLGFGLKIGDNLKINTSVGFRVATTLGIPVGLAPILTEGNANYTGDTPLELNCDKMLTAQAWLRLSAGAAYTIPGLPLTVGARINILDGVASASADEAKIKLFTSEDYSQVRGVLDYTFRTAGIAAYDSTGLSISGAPANMGFTFDLGATYQIGHFDISASLLDFGPGIHWSQNATVMASSNSEGYEFNGLALTSLIQGGTLDTAQLQALGDSLAAILAYNQTEESFWSGVPTRLNLGVSYTVNDFVRVGYLLHGEWDRGIFYKGSNFRFNNTLSAGVNLFNFCEVSLANSLVFDSQEVDLFNPGIMVSLNPGRVAQFYFLVDYISSLRAVDTKAINFMFGLNITGFKK